MRVYNNLKLKKVAPPVSISENTVVCIIVIASVLALVSCKSQESETMTDDSPRLSIAGSASSFSELGFHEELPLVTENEFIARIDFLKFAGDHILLGDSFFGQQLLLFNTSGTLRHKIGKRGRGPGEYINPQASGIFDKKIYVASSGTQRMEVFDLNGAYLRSFSLAGQMIMYDMLFGSFGHIYILNPTRYLKYSIAVLDTSGKKLNEISEIDEEFKHAFDTFNPPSSFAINVRDELYQIFIHRYEIRVFDKKGQALRTIRCSSPFYKAPDYEKAKTVRGIDHEKRFMLTFTHLRGIFLLKPDLIAVVLRNWESLDEYREVIEFWEASGKFLTRYKVEEDEKLVATHNEYLEFSKEGPVDE